MSSAVSSSLKFTLALTSLSLLLSACGGGGGSGRADTFVYQQSADIPTLDPGGTYDNASSAVVENLYETLLTYKGSSLREFQPLLATQWSSNAAGTQYTFTLRSGVKFHSGNTLSCDDAAYTFQRNLVTNAPESGNWFLSDALLGTSDNAKTDSSITWQRIQDAVKCNDGQLVLTLPKPDPALLAKLAYTGQSIVDKQWAIQQGEWDGTEATWKDWVGKDLQGSGLSAKPSGTGAYKLVNRDANALAFQAFDGYWGGKPTISNIVFQKVPEQAARLEAIKQGDADMVETGGRAPIEQQLKDQSGIKVIDELPDTSAFAIFMNEQVQPGSSVLGSGKLDGQGIPANFFSDVDVRRGFRAAFDTATYIKDVQQGKGEARTMPLPDTFPGYDASLPRADFDPKAAAAALKQAWNGQVWEKGFTINAVYRAGSVPSQTAMEILKKNVEALNPKFKINLKAKAWSTMLQDFGAGKEVLVLSGWAPDYADADNFLYTYFSSQGFYYNRTHLKDPQIDSWLEQARATTDQAARNRLYAQVGQRAFDQAYYILLPSNPGILAVRGSVEGISQENYNPMRGFAGGVLWKNLSRS
ncbi:peptide ABC transporter substrate-binding protein [Deinococcus irradiatisoli]|uniref:Peptide ABC transporter substrate-binding protein n=1 Tax=Deinococcus irradiatisoli TaxID=2202254 RepID=A0A2Z3JJ18_9DEIO|nr:ABC transporter substrate-binding protein [Deinococcus irradiatisoli]AWN23591.1 peptide ABC transporter substrate-binding protein [Deinococcus irradiatisoli]